MKNHISLILTAILIAVTLSACGAQIPEPTPTPEPSNTPEPTQIPTPVFELGEVKELPAGGYSFQPILGYKTTINYGNTLTIFDENRTHTIFVMGLTLTYLRDNESPEDTIDSVLRMWEERGFAEFTKNETFPINIGGVEGIATNLTGTTAVSPIEGQIVQVMPSEDKLFWALATTQTGDENKDKWKTEGSHLFSTLLETIQFIEFDGWEEGACPISTDDTYGYSKDNPIRIGGGSSDGPARVQAYLESLHYPESGLDGIAIYSTNTWSLEHGDSIVDAYEVIYGGEEPFILYFDEYTYEELLAPSGFICWTTIPLVEP